MVRIVSRHRTTTSNMERVIATRDRLQRNVLYVIGSSIRVLVNNVFAHGYTLLCIIHRQHGAIYHRSRSGSIVGWNIYEHR